MTTPDAITAGAVATWLYAPSFRRSGRGYHATVRVLDVRKKTARIEARRYDGTTDRRFVKLSRLWPGARWR